MSLITEFGRLDRAAITARAQEIYYSSGTKMKWGDARAAAYREAAMQLRAMFNRQSAVPPRETPKREAAHV